MFRILVVDDDPAAAHLLQEMMKNLQRSHDLYFTKTGLEALDFLHCRGGHMGAPRPDLILLDMNMPGLNGLETLSAIKSDPELCVIPVIMLSTISSPHEVRRCYEAHANCYVLKPTDLEGSVKFLQAVEAFWIDFALLPSCDERTPRASHSVDSKRKDNTVGAARRRPHWSDDCTQPRGGDEPNDDRRFAGEGAESPSRGVGCEEHHRLLDGFGEDGVLTAVGS